MKPRALARCASCGFVFHLRPQVKPTHAVPVSATSNTSAGAQYSGWVRADRHFAAAENSQASRSTPTQRTRSTASLTAFALAQTIVKAMLSRGQRGFTSKRQSLCGRSRPAWIRMAAANAIMAPLSVQSSNSG